MLMVWAAWVTLMMFMWCQAGGEPKSVGFASRKVALPESLDDWDDFDLSLSTTKNKPKRNACSPVTKPNAAAAVATTTVNVRKKSLFDDDDDDDILWVWLTGCFVTIIEKCNSFYQAFIVHVSYSVKFDSLSRSCMYTCLGRQQHKISWRKWHL